MKSHISVLINGTTKDIGESLTEALEQYRLDEDIIESINAHHWDYWG